MNLEELQIRNAFLEKENSALKRAIRELVSEPIKEQTVSIKPEISDLDFPELLKKVNKKIKDGFVYSEQELDFVKNANKSGFEPTTNQYNWLLKISNKKSEIKKPAFIRDKKNVVDDVDYNTFFDDNDIPF